MFEAEAEQIAIRCTILCGGTSKGVYLLEHDIPPPVLFRDRLLKCIMGSPDVLQIDRLGGARLITSRMTTVFVHAEACRLEGSELPEFFSQSPTLLDRICELRGKAAERIGLTSDWHDVDRQSPSLPLFVAVSSSAPYANMRGEAVDPASINLCARLVWHYKCHENMTGTGSMCEAAASRIPGSVVNQVMSAEVLAKGTLRIGHPMGVIVVSVEGEPSNAEGGVSFKTLGFSWTARRIMDEIVYVPRERLDRARLVA